MPERVILGSSGSHSTMTVDECLFFWSLSHCTTHDPSLAGPSASLGPIALGRLQRCSHKVPLFDHRSATRDFCHCSWGQSAEVRPLQAPLHASPSRGIILFGVHCKSTSRSPTLTEPTENLFLSIPYSCQSLAFSLLLRVKPHPFLLPSKTPVLSTPEIL